MNKGVNAYTFIKSEKNKGPDIGSRSFDDQGNTIQTAMDEMSEWERSLGLNLEWMDVRQWIADLVFPKEYSFDSLASVQPLRDLLIQSVERGDTRCFSSRILDADRPIPLPLDRASAIRDELVSNPEKFPLNGAVLNTVFTFRSLPQLPIPDLRQVLNQKTATVAFHGGGGDTIAAQSVGFDVVCGWDTGVEERTKFQSLCLKNPNGASCSSYSDFLTLPVADLPHTSLCSGGPPCPPYSRLGWRQGQRDPRDLFLKFIDFLCVRARLGKPYPFIVIEEVPEMVTMGRKRADGLTEGGAMVEEGIKALREVGYLIKTEELNPVHFGAPLQKIRWFLRGVHHSCADAIVPVEVPPDTKPKCIASILESDQIAPPHLFLPEHCKSDLKWKSPEKGPTSWTEPWLVATLGYGVGQPAYPHRVIHSFNTSFICLASGNSCWVLTPSGNIRRFTIRELLALHGLPHSYHTDEPWSLIHRFVGNCICPPSMKAVLTSLLRSVSPRLDSTVDESPVTREFHSHGISENLDRQSRMTQAADENDENKPIGNGAMVPKKWRKRFQGNIELNAAYEDVKRAQRLRFLQVSLPVLSKERIEILWGREKKKLYEAFEAMCMRCAKSPTALTSSEAFTPPETNGRGSAGRTARSLIAQYPPSTLASHNNLIKGKTAAEIISKFPPSPLAKTQNPKGQSVSDLVRKFPVKLSQSSLRNVTWAQPLTATLASPTNPGTPEAPVVTQLVQLPDFVQPEVAWDSPDNKLDEGLLLDGANPANVGRKRKRIKLHGYISPAMRSRILRARSVLLSSDLAPTTKKRYVMAFEQYLEFCNAAALNPYLCGSNPMEDTETLIQFACYEFNVQGNAFGTIQGKLYGIRYHLIDCGLPDPLKDKPLLKRVLKGMKKQSRKTVRKLPVTPAMVKYVINSVDHNSPRGLGVAVAILTAFMFLLRASEYAADDELNLGPHVVLRKHVKVLGSKAALERTWHLRYKMFGPPELMKILLPQKSGQKESCSARRDESGGWHPFFSQTNIFPPNFASKLKTYHCSSPTLIQN